MRSPKLRTSGRGFDRTAVQDALTHALNLWKRITPKEYPNGAVVFCSEELAEVFHPPMPLRGRLYDCGRQFKTSVIQSAIDTQLGPAYGLIAVDGSAAAFGKVQGLGIRMTSGPMISEMGRIDAHIAGRTRRGGQSALRYSRLRDESELAFLRKVADRAVILLTDVSGIIIAGKADMKHKLAAELPEPVQKQIMCTLDLSCNAGSEALRQAALRAAESVSSAQHSGLDCEIQHFLELTLRESSMCCYGEIETARALEMGAVERLLLSADLQTTISADDWKALAALHGTHVDEIHPRTQQASQFCKSFRIGGCLRWPVEAHLLEDVEEEVKYLSEHASKASAPHDSQSSARLPVVSQQSSNLTKADDMSAVAAEEIDSESISTADTADVEQHRSQTLAWFQSELKGVLGDSSAAEALTACVEVVLSDELTSRDEIKEGVVGIVSAEGIPEELAWELMRRW